jgi:Kef-type K+ transport system membrane component KefB
MGDASSLGTLGILIMAAAAVTMLARLIKMPSIVGYILAGLLVGPISSAVSPAAGLHGAVDILGEVGIVLLMFLVGIELSLERIREVGRVAVLAGLGQVLFTAAGGLVLALVLGFTWMESIFLATALTFSSTVVVVKLLDQKQELHTLYGRIAVGIFLVQDLVVIIVLTFLAGLGDPSMLTAGAMLGGVGKAFAGMGAMLAGSLLAARYLLPRPFGWAARAPRTLFVWSMAWCFACVTAALGLGLSPEIGAFLGGLSVAQLRCSHELKRRVQPLMSFFIVVFFVALGANMQLDAARAHWQEAIVLSLFVLIGNPVIFLWIIARCGYGERTAFLTSVTVAQISEFSFIFAAMGTAANLIAPSILSLVAVIGLVTIGVSAYMILYNHQLYGWVARTGLLRVFRAADRDPAGDADEAPRMHWRDHVVVVGMNELGRGIATALHERGALVLAIDSDPRKLEGLPCPVMVGNVEYLSLLQEAGLPDAALVISTLRIEATNRMLMFHCRQWGVPAVIHAFDRSVIAGLRALGPDYLIEPKAEAARALAAMLRDREVMAR